MPFSDPYPGKPKILFIGTAESSHTQSWINLLAGSEINVRFFSVTDGLPPKDWLIPSYLTTPNLSRDLPSQYRETLYSTPEKKEQRIKGNIFWKIQQGSLRFLNSLNRANGLPQWEYHDEPIRNVEWPLYKRFFLTQQRSKTPKAWLAEIIQTWQPDIIHTLGLFDNQGGQFYYEARQEFGLEKIGRWVLQLRGGSDLALRQYDLEVWPYITKILKECDQVITDNYDNMRLLRETGIEGKIASISPIPGAGGVDVDALRKSWAGSTSQRRMILIPKAYDSQWSVVLPVFEALVEAWEHIQPCEITMLVMVVPSSRAWYNTLPMEIRNHCQIYGRIPHNEVLQFMPRARVMLAPSLVDGVPNSLYEAMACGALPIVSPLKTITPIVQEGKNVFFARNLYPHDIAQALIRSMQEDTLIDHIAQNNLELVAKNADRNIIREKVIRYYLELAG